MSIMFGWRKSPPVQTDEGALVDIRNVDTFQAWTDEWEAARKAAVDAVQMPSDKYRLWQTPAGWWKVGHWIIEYYPKEMPRDRYSWVDVCPPSKPSMKVTAYPNLVPFEPQFKAEAEARKWLRDYLKPPEVKQIRFDAEGNELTNGPDGGVVKRRPAKPIGSRPGTKG